MEFKKLGQLVNWVDNRNKGLKSTNLLGISIDKFFMPSVANVIGTDLSSYKVVSVNQFVCNPMHVGRDEKMPVALYLEGDCSIVSPAYFVFEVSNDNIILPEYLMLWFRRNEFDREVWFHTDGSVRGGILWEELCELTVPVPSIVEQKEIVAAYNDIERRIALKRKINDNLEAIAMAKFRSFFVTFEQYGGNIPSNWVKTTIGNVVSVVRGASPRPIQDYMSETGMPWVKISDASASVSKYLFNTAECITLKGVSSSRTVTPGTMIVSNSASPGLPMIMEITACVHDGWLIIDDYNGVTQEYMYYHFLNERQSLVSSSNGSVFNNLKTDIVKAHPVIVPDEEAMANITRQFKLLNAQIKQNAKEIIALNDLKGNLLSQLSNG